MFDGGVNAFGNMYLNKIGFAPFGLILSWIIKISHIITALLLFVNKFIKPVCFFTIYILIEGIVLVHFKEGWFVVGGGRNGMEYNFLIIAALVQIIISDHKPIKSKTLALPK